MRVICVRETKGGRGRAREIQREMEGKGGRGTAREGGG